MTLRKTPKNVGGDWGDPGVEGRVQEVGCEGMDWIELAQNKDRWWELVNVVLNFRVS
jgi:hypothetical protein